MLWQTLQNILGKQPDSFMRKNHVYLLTNDPKTGHLRKVYVELKKDAKGRPYLIEDNNKRKEK